MTIASAYATLIDSLPNEPTIPDMIVDEVWEATAEKIDADAREILVDTTNCCIPGKPEAPRFYTFSDGSRFRLENYLQERSRARAFLL